MTAASPLNIAISGATGRMGRMLLDAVRTSDDLTLSGALVSAGNAAAGTDAYSYAGAMANVLMSDQLETALAGAGCLIDFTRPEATLEYLDFCARNKIRMVIGTTGFDAAGKQAIAEAGKHTAIVFAPNMSVGVNVTMMLLDAAARQFAQGYDIEVVEAHHRHKVDAPSGTALQMGQVLAKATGRSLEDCAVYARQGVTGPRDPSSIGFATIRGGDIIGDHTVMFAGIGERIEISHKSSNRLAYADGSLRAARFLAGHTTGLFNMQDVLGLKPL